MTLLSYIKRDREMDFTHWRYRLLHWTFGINPTSKEDSAMPGFMYTHYCPLFHITNILAIVFPLVFLIRFCVACIVITGKASKAVVETLFPFIQKPFQALVLYAQNKREAALKAYMATEQYAELQKQKIVSEEKARVVYLYDLHNGDLEYLKQYFLDGFKYLSVAEAVSIVQGLKDKEDKLIELHKLRAIADEARRKELAERMVFWIRFSQIFVKGLTTLVIGAATLGLVYSLYLIIPLIVSALVMVTVATWAFLGDFVSALMTVSLAGLFATAIKYAVLICLGLLGITAVIYGAIKAGPSVGNAIGRWFATPISIVKSIFNAGVDASVTGVESIFEFCIALYEDNCPTIKLGESEKKV